MPLMYAQILERHMQDDIHEGNFPLKNQTLVWMNQLLFQSISISNSLPGQSSVVSSGTCERTYVSLMRTYSTVTWRSSVTARSSYTGENCNLPYRFLNSFNWHQNEIKIGKLSLLSLMRNLSILYFYTAKLEAPIRGASDKHDVEI